MNGTKPCAILAWVAAAMFLAGCPHQRPLPAPMTLEQVVEKVNQNNELLPWFKARLRTASATVVDRSGWSHRLDMFGYLIYAQPAHLYMNCFVGTAPVMGLGGNSRVYWLWVRPQAARCWVGSYARWNPTSGGPIPIHPRRLTQLLGVDAIPSRPDRGPWPVLRVSEPAGRANIIQLVMPMPGGGALLRELWVDRDTNRPRRVRLFDGFGQPALESTLSDWRKATGSAGWFPHDVRIRWIARKQADGGVVRVPGSRLHLRFSSVEVDEKYSPAKRPKIYEFRYPPDLELVPLDDQSGPGVLARTGATN